MASPNDSLISLRARLAQSLPWKGLLIATVTTLVLIWLAFAPAGLLGKADAVGYAVCHQIATRSFLIGDRQFSVCARCTGQYLGAVLGLVYLSVLRPRRTARPPWWIVGVLALGAASYALDGINSFLHLIPQAAQFWLYEPQNALRLLTGMMVGLGMSVMVFTAFNQTTWQEGDPRPVLEGGRDFGGLLLSAGALTLLVLSGNAFILYPLSLISAGGVLLLLTLIYAMVWIMIFRAENQTQTPRQLGFPLLAGFGVALAQILVLDALRFGLTGTWGGFPLG